MATLYILYGSATGNAEQIAKDLAARKPVPAPFVSVACEPLERYRKFSNTWLQQPKGGEQVKHGVLIVTSTTGNGDAPENASRFVRYVKRKTTVDLQPFRNVAFGVLGLGDTNYDMFCNTAKIVDAKLTELGGVRAHPLACADEATGLEDVVEPWLETIMDSIRKSCFEKKEEEKEEPDQKQAEAEVKAKEAETKSEPTSSQSETAQAKPESTVAKISPSTTNSAPPSQSESPLFILYGSATGNAEHIAKDLASTYELIMKNPDSKVYFPSVVCCELDQFKKKCQPSWEQDLPNGRKHGVLIVASTTGNGEPPENASRFVRYIKRKNTVDAMPFRNVAFAVLGLGDTNYDQFCATGKNIDKRLPELGGIRVVPVHCADEATGLEDVVEPWTNTILNKVTDACRASHTGVVSVTSTSSNSKTMEKNTEKNESEEKKMEPEDTLPSQTDSTSSSQGVNTIRSLLLLEKKAHIPRVDPKLLPSLGASLSSCALLNHDQLEKEDNTSMHEDLDRMTVSTSSSQALHYTAKKPFDSHIIKARYLTNTSIQACEKVATTIAQSSIESSGTDDDRIIRSTQVFNKHFPLAPAENQSDTHQRNGKRVIEMTLALPDDFTLEYAPGDSLGLLVDNTPDAVCFVLNMLKDKHGVDPEQKLSIDAGKPITVKDAFRSCVDLCSPLKNKRIISKLSQFATNAQEEQGLRLLASKSPDGEKLFQEYVDKQRLSVVDILREFPSTQSITVIDLISILPGIPPRYYSVSSSPLDHKRLSLTVAFSVVDYITPSMKVDGTEVGLRRIGGIATQYLEILCAPHIGGSSSSTLKEKLRIFPKPSSDFHMPESLSTPLVLIGPGTGIAPFMGFLYHRRALSTSLDSTEAASTVVEGTWRGDYDFEENEIAISKKDARGLVLANDFRGKAGLGSVDVFFGCRQKDHDWLYRKDMEELEQQGIITCLNTAFSRDANNEGKKYVQDIMRTQSCKERLADLVLKQNASVYICGDGNAMAKDVQEAIMEVISEKIDVGLDEAKNYLANMKTSKRLLLDIWTS